MTRLPWIDEVDLSAASSGASIFQLPFDFAKGKKIGPRRIKKRILPIGKVFHGGRTLDFSRDRLAQIVANFKKKVFDYVPVNAATEDNRHNENPFLNLGKVSDLILGKEGLDAVIDLNQIGSQLYNINPLVGASVRFYDDFLRQHDKRYFGPVVRHVCVTQDPHVTGMPPAEVLLSSATPVGVVDMTASSFVAASDRKERTMETDQATTTETEEVEGMEGQEQRDFAGLFGPQSGKDLSDPMVIDEYVANMDRLKAEVEAAQNKLDAMATDMSASRRQELHRDFTNRAFRLVTQHGVSPAAINMLRPALEGEVGEQTFTVTDMTTTTDGQQQEVQRDVALRELLWDFLGQHARRVDMTGERGHAVNPVEQPQVNQQIAANRGPTQGQTLGQFVPSAAHGGLQPQAQAPAQDFSGQQQPHTPDVYDYILQASGVRSPKGFSPMPDGTTVPN